ncbi:unnamed protein product, partial [Ectocarpus sp. 4 AP-2014]
RRPVRRRPGSRFTEVGNTSSKHTRHLLHTFATSLGPASPPPSAGAACQPWNWGLPSPERGSSPQGTPPRHPSPFFSPTPRPRPSQCRSSSVHRRCGGETSMYPRGGR